ncbi:DUF3617 domain-containing protein [Erythrobacter sp.]|uniref:DUF3617 domain-containing protein n=1 Tax=Erythrobacter sp. TaxID=1042 RepID=UPI001425BEC7|nr:DUF3617 domain-containing protein [Erythrobacter sp.]QIQ85551.1 MAG: DUF3617 domain-containing protein [Erythrobacter sp.]
MMNLNSLAIACVGIGFAAAITVPDALSAQVEPPEMRPETGKYSADITVQQVDIPGAPPQMADMMTRMMSRRTTYCLTEEDVEEGYRAITRRSQGEDGEDCTYDRFTMEGGELDAQMTCRVDGRTMTMTMEGTGTPTSSDITMTMNGDMGVGPGTIRMRVIHQRLGPC